MALPQDCFSRIRRRRVDQIPVCRHHAQWREGDAGNGRLCQALSPFPSNSAASLARSASGKPRSAAARASRVPALLVSVLPVQAAVQAATGASASRELDCVSDGVLSASHP